MLTALEVENFKGIGEPVRVELRPITLLFGPNSAGKSSILHALHYAREVLERRNVDADRTVAGGALVDLGGFETAVHLRDKTRDIRLRIDFGNDRAGFPNEVLYGPDAMSSIDSLYVHDGLGYVFGEGWVEFKVRWSNQSEKPYVAEYSVGADGRLIAKLESNPDGTQIRLSSIDLSHPLVTYDGRGDMEDDGRLPLETDDWGLASTPCETGTKSALPDFSQRLGIQRPTIEELTKRARPVAARVLARQEEAIDELVVEMGGVAEEEDSVAASENGLGADRLQEQEDELLLQAQRVAQGIDELWSEELQVRLSMLMIGFGQLVLKELRSLIYLGPLRELPERNYEAPRSSAEARWANGLAAWDVLSREDAAFVSEVGKWLERLGTGYSIRVDEFREIPRESLLWRFLGSSNAGTEWIDSMEGTQEEFEALPTRRRLVLVDRENQFEVLPMEVGVGISQLIPVIVALLMGKEGLGQPAIVVEQPELHVHPAVQVELGDLLALRADEESRLVIVETHSEHMLLRLLRRIEETGSGELPPGAPSLTPGRVSVVYVENEGGRLQAKELRIDEAGEFIDRWPHGFFEERMEELS